MSLPALRLLPGLDGTARLLAPFVKAARDAGFADVAAIAYPTDRVLAYDALEALAREALPRAAPFVLLGESFSGPVAIAIAADPPPNLRGLVLSTTFAKAPLPVPSPLAAFARIAPVRTLPTAALSFALFGRWATPALRRELRDALDTVAPAVLRARAEAAMRVDVRDRLARIRVPALCLRAAHDRLLRPGAQRALCASLSDAREVAIDGPHLLLQTRTQTAVDAVARFAAGLG
jgi:pimeloyl-ACP methyl ester carboxylesterase